MNVVLVSCNIVNNKYQRNWCVLSIFAPNKSFGQLLKVSLSNQIYTDAFRPEFSYIDIWFTDQNFKAIEIENRINLNLVINEKSIQWDIPGADPEILKRGGALCWSLWYSWSTKKLLGFRWSKKAKTTLETISFW